MGHPWGQAPTNPLGNCPGGQPCFFVVSLFVSLFCKFPGSSGSFRGCPGGPGISREFRECEKMEPPRPEPGVSPGAKLRGAPGAALGHPWGQAPTNSLSSCPTLFLVVSLSVFAFLQISGEFREFPGMPGDSREVPGISGNARGFPEIPGIFREFRKTIFGDPGHPRSQKTCERTCFLRT